MFRANWGELILKLEIAGIEIGHWTDPDARTGCTCVVLPEGTIASGEVRGGAPATREFALLAPERLVQHVDAVLLTGGSAFGLAAADGAMEALEAEGRGYDTLHGRIPIVVAMGLYDLGVGDSSVRPDAHSGRQAVSNRSADVATGQVGAGAGATFGKWMGPDHVRDGGIGIATTRRDEVIVTAIVAVNSSGGVGDGVFEQVVDGSFAAWPERSAPFGNTSLCVVVTNAAIDKMGCHLVAQAGHDGLARAIFPAHGRSDGDAVVAAATGAAEADVDDVRVLAAAAVAEAVSDAVGTIEA